MFVPNKNQYQLFVMFSSFQKKKSVKKLNVEKYKIDLKAKNLNKSKQMILNGSMIMMKEESFCHR